MNTYNLYTYIYCKYLKFLCKMIFFYICEKIWLLNGVVTNFSVHTLNSNVNNSFKKAKDTKVFL